MKCIDFSSNTTLVGSSWAAKFCGQPCTVSDYCPTGSRSSSGGSACACQSDGRCRTSGGSLCYVTDPSDGK